jgi:hypothetical protein
MAMGTAIRCNNTRFGGDTDVVKLAYSAPEIQLGVDGIVSRMAAGRAADRLYLVLDYAMRRAWIERGDSMFYAPEAEDGAGTYFKIRSHNLLIDVKIFFAGIKSPVLVELKRPGAAVCEIEEYCRDYI